MNWHLIGHQWAVDLLHKHILGGNPRHAYLLTGPSGLGKTTLAVRLTQALFCENPIEPGQPCLECKSCRRVKKMEHPDLYPIQVQENSQVIKIDQIRELQHSLSLSPYEAPYQVAVLEDFNFANLSAQNALLKTLEEPPPHVILILTAENSDDLLETIVSRCEGIQLRLVPLETLKQALHHRYSLSEEEAERLAHLSNGRPGIALEFAESPDQLKQWDRWIQEHQNLLSSSLADRFQYAKKFKSDSKKFQAITETWISLWRDVLLTAADADAPLTNLGHSREIQQLAAQVDLRTVRAIIQQLEKTHRSLQLYANTQLTIENLMLHLPSFSAGSPDRISPSFSPSTNP